MDRLPFRQRSGISATATCHWLLLAILALTTALLLSACDRKPQVDMSQTVKDAPASADSRPPLTIAIAAMISPETTRQYYEQLLQVIAEKMGRRAVFLQRRTYAEVNNLVKNRQVDLAFVCAGPYAQGHDEFGMELVAVPVVHGKKVYHSYIIAGRTSPINSFNDLKGRRFAFTDPSSNTGCLVPTYMLAKQGTTPDQFFREAFFSNSHDNSIKAVAEGQADGAAVDSLIYEFFAAIDPQLTNRTKIVETSPPYGIPPIVVHPAIAPEVKEQLRQVLFGLHQDPKGAELLKKLQIERFEAGSDGMYDTVREMSRWVAKQKVK